MFIEKCMSKPGVGRLVLFPSYVWHGTIPFHAAQNRTTIAFDAVPGISDAAAPEAAKLRRNEAFSHEPAFAGQAAFSISATRAGIALFIIRTAFSRRRLYRSPPSAFEISDGARARNESLTHWERYSMRG